MSSAASGAEAAREALRRARASFGGEATPKLAIAFASLSYPDLSEIGPRLSRALGDVPIVGGTSGLCVLGPERVAHQGVSIVLLGGDDVEVDLRVASSSSPNCVDAVAAAARVARAADAAARRGLAHFSCLVFGPAFSVDGEELVAAVRKGAGAHAQLAGALTGNERNGARPKVFTGGELRSDRVVMTGLFTRKPVGIAARHGQRVMGRHRTVTRADGIVLYEIDGRPALDTWREDVQKLGSNVPNDPESLLSLLSNHYPLGVLGAKDGGTNGRREPAARPPIKLRDDGGIELTTTISEGARVAIIQVSKNDLLRASSEAAAAAALGTGAPISGALVLSCTGRLAVLGKDFAEEPARIRERLGAPIGGACVFGEIARNVRDADAFFNSTAVVVAF